MRSGERSHYYNFVLKLNKAEKVLYEIEDSSVCVDVTGKKKLCYYYGADG